LPSQTDTWWCWNSFRRPEGWNPNRREPLRRKLRNTHVQLISLGGAIGTGFLVASGEALQTAGPLSLLLAFAYVGVTCYFTIYALGEMVSYFPEYGAFATYSGWFIDHAWGGAMGWNYALQWLLTLPLELLAASITLSYWSWGESVSRGVWAIVLLAIIVVINLFFGVLGFGHIEACISMLKVIAIIGFM
jgi:amino acid transporter